MAIVRVDVISGPNVSPDGTHRGQLEFELDDGRILTRNIKATDAAAWSERLVDIDLEVQAQQEAEDARKAAESDGEIVDTDSKQASKAMVAVQYLRAAHQLPDPYPAYLKYARFNNWRLQQGYNMTQVKAALVGVLEMTEVEFDELVSEYQYLSNSARVTAMEAYQAIRGYWDNR